MKERMQQDPALERVLGLENACYGDRRRHLWARLAKDDETTKALFEAPPGFPGLVSVGVRAELSDLKRLEVEAPPPSRWLLRTEPGLESRVRIERDAPWKVQLDAEGRGAVSLVLESGQGLLVEFDPRGLTCTPIEVAPWAADENPPAPDVAAWARAAGDDWLADVLTERLKEGTLWDKCVAMGLFVRLRREPRDHVKVAVERLLSGQPDPRDVEAFRWARMLRHDHVMAVDDGLAASLDNLEQGLGPCLELPGPHDPTWLAVLTALCRKRDEIQAALQVLGARAPKGPLQDRIRQLDDQAEQGIAALPQGVALEDEHLQRVALGDPEAWWARLAALP